MQLVQQVPCNRTTEQSKLLAAITLAAAKRLGGDALCVGEGDRLHKWKMARVGDTDDTGPRCINCYRVEVENFAAVDGKKFKFDPQRLLYSLQYQHNAIPPDFDLVLVRDPRQWFGAVATELLAELNRHEEHLFDKLRTG